MAFLWMAFYGWAVAAAVLGLYAFSLPGLDLSLLIPSACIFSAVAGIWAVDFGITLGRKVRISRAGMTRRLAFPLVVVVCLALQALDVPRTVRFNLSRAELQAAATRDASGDRLPGWIGLMPVNGMWRDPDGTTTFWLSGDENILGYPCGLIYAPRGEPSQKVGQLGRQIADGWWRWCEND